MEKRTGSLQFKQKTKSGNWTRRSVVEWLGKGCVLSLAGRGLTACSGGDGTVTPLQDDGCGQGVFDFEPTRCNKMAWAERTVDPQVLEDILADWQLSVGGMVDNEITLSFDQLVSLPRHNPVVDFHCVEGWSVNDIPWNGVRLSYLLERVGIHPSATYVNFYTIGGKYNESLPLDVALENNTILAYGTHDSTLSVRHGFPARIVIPRLFGYKNAKYVERIELSDTRIEGFWVAWGYPYDGEVDAERLRPGKF